MIPQHAQYSMLINMLLCFLWAEILHFVLNMISDGWYVCLLDVRSLYMADALPTHLDILYYLYIVCVSCTFCLFSELQSFEISFKLERLPFKTTFCCDWNRTKWLHLYLLKTLLRKEKTPLKLKSNNTFKVSKSTVNNF